MPVYHQVGYGSRTVPLWSLSRLLGTPSLHRSPLYTTPAHHLVDNRPFDVAENPVSSTGVRVIKSVLEKVTWEEKVLKTR